MNRQQRRAQARALRKVPSHAAHAGMTSPRGGAFTRAAHTPSQSGALQADKLELLERHDGFAGLRNGLRAFAEKRGDWAGIPMPIEGHKLIIEPRYPGAAEISKIGAEKDEPLPEGVTLRNTFYSHKMRCDIVIWNEPDGKVKWGPLPAFHHFTHDLMTLGASQVWGIEQEAKAQQTLATLLSHYQFKCYLLTGMFLERSKRSGLSYMFRRLKPTVVIDARAESEGSDSKIRCALCMHPIGYYQHSWAGAMCPTDDVIAHLMMMRGDEPRYWKLSNQHPPHRPEAGL